MILILLETGPWSLGTEKKVLGVSAGGDLGWAQCLSSVPTFSWSQSLGLCVSFVEVFRSDGIDTWMTLKHHLAWSLITISGQFTDNSLSVRICISASKGGKRLDFQWSSQACVHIPLLRYFDSVMQNGFIFAGYVTLASQSPYPIIVYSVANYRPHFWANMSFSLSQLSHFLFTYLPYIEWRTPYFWPTVQKFWYVC